MNDRPEHPLDPVPQMTRFGPADTSIATKCPTCKEPMKVVGEIWTCTKGHRFNAATLVSLL